MIASADVAPLAQPARDGLGGAERGGDGERLGGLAGGDRGHLGRALGAPCSARGQRARAPRPRPRSPAPRRGKASASSAAAHVVGRRAGRRPARRARRAAPGGPRRARAARSSASAANAGWIARRPRPSRVELEQRVRQRLAAAASRSSAPSRRAADRVERRPARRGQAAPSPARSRSRAAPRSGPGAARRVGSSTKERVVQHAQHAAPRGPPARPGQAAPRAVGEPHRQGVDGEVAPAPGPRATVAPSVTSGSAPGRGVGLRAARRATSSPVDGGGAEALVDGVRRPQPARRPRAASPSTTQVELARLAAEQDVAHRAADDPHARVSRATASRTGRAQPRRARRSFQVAISVGP